MKETARNIFNSAFYDIIKWFAVYAGGICWTVFGTDWLATKYLLISSYQVIITIIFLLIVLAIITNYFLKFNKFLPNFKKIDSNFIIESSTFHLKVIEQRHYKLVKDVVRIARKNGLSSYIEYFGWNDDVKVKSLIVDHKVVKTKSNSTSHRFDIVFAKSLSKNEKIRTKLEYDLKCSKNECKKFINAKVKEYCESMKFILEFDSEYFYSKVYFSESYDDNPIYDIKRKELKPDETGRFTVEIKNPKLLHFYKIEWE